METVCCVIFLLTFSLIAEITQNLPVTKNGWLQVKENEICYQSGHVVQLRDIVTHGLQ